jgi:hypothetical protein
VRPLTSLRLPRRKTLIDWSAAALVAAAFYLAPFFLLGAIEGVAWAIALLVASLVVLAFYTTRFGSALGVLLTAVLVLTLELVVRFGTAFGDVCGDSHLANDLEWAGTGVILLGIGTWSVRKRRVLPLLAALLLAGAWIFAVARLIPGGAGGCFE